MGIRELFRGITQIAPVKAQEIHTHEVILMERVETRIITITRAQQQRQGMYQARNGKWYTKKETPAEYRLRKLKETQRKYR